VTLKSRIGDLLRTRTVITYFALKLVEHFLQAEPDHVTNQRRALWTIDDAYFEEFGETGLDLMALYMDKLVGLLRRHDIALTIAVYPWPDQIVNDDRDSIQETFWRDWSAKHDVPFVNFFSDFLVRGDSPNPQVRAREIVTENFIPGDIHWNARGNKLIADRFLEMHSPSFRLMRRKGGNPPVGRVEDQF
jgi:hypothetical protein